MESFSDAGSAWESAEPVHVEVVAGEGWGGVTRGMIPSAYHWEKEIQFPAGVVLRGLGRRPSPRLSCVCHWDKVNLVCSPDLGRHTDGVWSCPVAEFPPPASFLPAFDSDGQRLW